MTSERALTLALAELDGQRGVELASTQIRRAAAQLDPIREQGRTRPLGGCVSLCRDAGCEQVASMGRGGMRPSCWHWVMGGPRGRQTRLLGVSVALSEPAAHGARFRQRLVARGLPGVQLIVREAHEGPQTARTAVFGAVPRPRCPFPRPQNAQADVPRQELNAEVAADLRASLTAPTQTDAHALLARTSAHAIAGPQVVRFLRHRLRHLPGNLLVLWDGAAIHHGQAVNDFLAAGAAKRLHLERLPASAPDLNPADGVWHLLKHHERGNLVCEALWELKLELRLACPLLAIHPRKNSIHGAHGPARRTLSSKSCCSRARPVWDRKSCGCRVAITFLVSGSPYRSG